MGQKIICIIKKTTKNYFFLALPYCYYLRSTSNQKTDTRKIMKLLWNSNVPTTSMSQVESFCVFFSFFLTLPNIREKKLKKSAFYKKKTLARKKKTVASQQQTK